jgi:histone H3/H4
MNETLVVVSKIKKYIKEKSEMNTSATAIDELTRVVQKECDKAIEKAKAANRKTVMDRDFISEE